MSPFCQPVPTPCTATPIPQVLGLGIQGSLTDSDDSGYLNGSQITTGPLGGGLVSLSACFKGPIDIAGQRRYQLALYSDSGGRPGTFLGRTAAGTITANSCSTLKVQTPLVLTPNTDYWVMVNNNGLLSGANTLTYNQGGVGAWSQNPVPFGTWPATFPSSSSNFTFAVAGTLLP